jgi:hypothetical protein
MSGMSGLISQPWNRLAVCGPLRGFDVHQVGV